MSGTLTFAGTLMCRAPAFQSGRARRRPIVGAVASAFAPAPAAARAPASLYQVLRVKETASTGEIKAAYRSLAKRFHPDVAQGGEGPDFVEIHRAYATLSDPATRARYDRSMGRIEIGGLGLAGDGRMRRRSWETDQCW